MEIYGSKKVPAAQAVSHERESAIFTPRLQQFRGTLQEGSLLLSFLTTFILY